ncbi:hypothetical protein [Carp edema virus]|nr:hypothetical protein [Carp edema virus]
MEFYKMPTLSLVMFELDLGHTWIEGKITRVYASLVVTVETNSVATDKNGKEYYSNIVQLSLMDHKRNVFYKFPDVASYKIYELGLMICESIHYNHFFLKNLSVSEARDEEIAIMECITSLGLIEEIHKAEQKKKELLKLPSSYASITTKQNPKLDKAFANFDCDDTHALDECCSLCEDCDNSCCDFDSDASWSAFDSPVNFRKISFVVGSEESDSSETDEDADLYNNARKQIWNGKCTTVTQL